MNMIRNKTSCNSKLKYAPRDMLLEICCQKYATGKNIHAHVLSFQDESYSDLGRSQIAFEMPIATPLKKKEEKKERSKRKEREK